MSVISSPYISPSASTNRMMLNVLIALVPGTLAYIWYFGYGLIINLIVAISFAILFEAGVLLLRKKPLMPYLSDYSAIVTGWLFALCIPMHSPWWLIVTGIGFAMIAGKHLYGGLGFNPFNPAMVGYVVILISFPKDMTTWFLPMQVSSDSLSLMESLSFTLGLLEPQHWDALTSATPLDQYKTGLGMNLMISEIRQSPVFGDFAGVGWEWIANWWFLGGVFLLYSKTIRWHIPLAMISGLLLFSLIFYVVDPDSVASPGFHLFSGGLMLGAFFIATDPVTSATTIKGRLLYGFLIGALVIVIRRWGGYPDGVAFAVLLANMAVPLIDYYTQPRVFGVNPPQDH
ncbi:MAG: electron transport complex subunit RsxD [Gammaproteobacteria bacterium]|nr:electron transport complex subunit RsxD [Gammaproteobacteria bacterium]MBL6999246.1 electron transport complex subunit RsxD [Gammaproteobacteria bacterium]